MKGVIIGRFQPLHNGHVELIREASRECDDVVLVIGSSNVHDEANPFTFEERERMIKMVIGVIQTIPMEDVTDDDAWVASVIENVPPFDIVYAGDEEDLKLWTGSRFKTKSIGRIGGIRGTDIRKKIIDQDESWKDQVPAVLVDMIRTSIEARAGINR